VKVIQRTPGRWVRGMHRKIGEPDTFWRLPVESKVGAGSRTTSQIRWSRTFWKKHARNCEITLIGEFRGAGSGWSPRPELRLVGAGLHVCRNRVSSFGHLSQSCRVPG